MDQEVLTAVAIAVSVAVGVMISLSKRTRDRAQEALLNNEQPGPKPGTKRQQQLMAQMAPSPEIPTIEELVAEEAVATGVNDIPGGDGLDVSLKLRVYWRDDVIRRGCADGRLQFRIDSGVSLDAADTDDVRLVCVRDGSEVAAQTDKSRDAVASDQKDDQ
jgi:hypothetical protein